MLMGHPPQIITRGRENAPQGCFEGLTPVQVSMVVQELIAYDSQVQEALADPLEVVQEIAQARPYAFHRVTVYTHAVRVTTRILACTMVDRSMIIDLLYAPPLHHVTSCCINRFQPASPYRQSKVRRRKDDPGVGTTARRIVA